MADIVPAMPDKPKRYNGDDCTGYPGRYGFFQAEYSNLWLDNIQLPPGLSRVKIKVKYDSSGFIYECTYYNFSDSDFDYIKTKDNAYWNTLANGHAPEQDEIPYFNGIEKDNGNIISVLTDNLYSYNNSAESSNLSYSFSQSMASNFNIMSNAVYNFENPDYENPDYPLDDNFIHADTFKLESATSVKIKE